MATEHANWNFETPPKAEPLSLPVEPAKVPLPIDEHGRVIRKDWSPRDTDDGRSTGVVPNLGGRLTPSTPTPVKPATEEPPAPSPDVQLDAAEIRKYRELLRNGVLDSDGLKRHYGLDDTDLAVVAGKRQSRSAVDAEIDNIERIMREDRPLYNKKYAGRYAQLLAAREQAARAVEAAAETEEQAPASEGSKELAEVTTELAKLAEKKRNDRRSITDKDMARELELIDRQEILRSGAQGMPPELIERFRATGGLPT